MVIVAVTVQHRVQQSLPADHQHHRPCRTDGGHGERRHCKHGQHEQRDQRRGGRSDTTGGYVARESTGEQHRRKRQRARPAQHRVTLHSPSTPKPHQPNGDHNN